MVAFWPRVKAEPVTRYWDEKLGRQTINRFWNMRTGKELSQLSGHDSNVGTLAFAPDGRSLVSGLHNGLVVTWKTPEFVLEAMPAGRVLGKADLTVLWKDLGEKDAHRAYEAVRVLAESRKEFASSGASRCPPRRSQDRREKSNNGWRISTAPNSRNGTQPRETSQDLESGSRFNCEMPYAPRFPQRRENASRSCWTLSQTGHLLSDFESCEPCGHWNSTAARWRRAGFC